MDHRKFALKLLIVMFSIALVGFWAEAAWDFSNAVNPATGQPLRLADLRVTPEMMRAVASPFARAYNNILALLLTFISLAIPITATFYTPKLTELFLRDRVNLIMLCLFALLAAHSLFAITISFDVWTGQTLFYLDAFFAISGWLLLMPYYFYVLSFIDPVNILKRVHRSLLEELEDAARGRYPVAESQKRVNQKIVNLGSVLLRAVDRSDRDISFDAIKTHLIELVRVREVKPRLPAEFFKVNTTIMLGMSSEAAHILSEQRIWMEHRIASQVALAYRSVLGKMPDGVSAIADAIKLAAHEEAGRGNFEVFDLLVRTLNTFIREAIKKKENASAYNVIYNYKSLVRRLLADRPARVPELGRYLRHYADFAREHGLAFIYELISYELGELVERAFDGGKTEAAEALLAAMLDLEDPARFTGLVKSRGILAGYCLERGRDAELKRIEASLRAVPAAVLAKARDVIQATVDRVFWELTDRGTNFNYVAPARREKVVAFFDGLLRQAHGPAMAGGTAAP